MGSVGSLATFHTGVRKKTNSRHQKTVANDIFIRLTLAVYRGVGVKRVMPIPTVNFTGSRVTKETKLWTRMGEII